MSTVPAELFIQLQTKYFELEQKLQQERVKNNELTIDNANYVKVLRIIAVRSKLEGFVNKMYPQKKNVKTGETIYGRFPALSVCDALAEIIGSSDPRFTDDPFVQVVRKRLRQFQLDGPMFLKFARWLYNQFSDTACHKMAAFCPSLPAYNDTASIEEMMNMVGIDIDIPAVKCVQIILKPIGLPLD